MHPLAPDLTQLTDDELHRNHAALMQRMTFSYRMGHGDLLGQLQLLLEDYNLEVQRRNQKMLEDANKNSRNFQDKIDIGR